MDIIVESFTTFVRERFIRYRIGRKFYPNGPYPGDQHGQNPYIKTEADVQVKYGGYLESWLIDRYPELTVHAELPVYSNSHERADLTLHRIGSGKYWVSRQQILETLEYIIEIKLANVVSPYYDFKKGGIDKDIRLLQSIPGRVKRYLILIDEAELIDPNRIKRFIEDTSAYEITIVSNNPKLNSAT